MTRKKKSKQLHSVLMVKVNHKSNATGKDLGAEEMILIAKEAGIHIHQDPHLSEFLQLLE